MLEFEQKSTLGQLFNTQRKGSQCPPKNTPRQAKSKVSQQPLTGLLTEHQRYSQCHKSLLLWECGPGGDSHELNRGEAGHSADMENKRDVIKQTEKGGTL